MAEENGKTTIRFTPYQFLGVIVMFIGLIATAVGPYMAVKTDINNINIKIAEIDLKITNNLTNNSNKILELETKYSKLITEHLLLKDRVRDLELYSDKSKKP